MNKSPESPNATGDLDRDLEGAREADQRRGSEVNQAKILAEETRNEEIKEQIDKLLNDKETVKTLESLRNLDVDLDYLLKLMAERQIVDSKRDSASEKVEPVEVSPAELGDKLKKKPDFSKFINKRVAMVVLTLGISSPFLVGCANGNEEIEPITFEEAALPTDKPVVESPEKESEFAKDPKYAGETIHGVGYDYSEYADRENKISYNAYGYDRAYQYGDRDETVGGIMEIATIEPEALASYAYSIFTDDEKKELGINGLSMVQIDHKFDQDGGGELQKKLLDKFNQILEDEENTRFEFYHENDTEHTNYIYFEDKNQDGAFTPDELELRYSTKKRNNAEQVDIYRTITMSDGKTKEVKMLDLNMKCGYQPNYEVTPPGVDYIDETDTSPTPPDTTPKPTGGTSTTTVPDPDPGPGPGPKPKPGKNKDAEKKNAGDVTPAKLDQKVTPPTTIEEDRANFDDVEAQRQAAEAAQKAAEEEARRQAEAEAEAKRQAEARAQAEEQARQEQAERAEAERRAAEEQAAREQAQREADENQTTPEDTHHDDTAAERAKLANGK